MLTVFFLISLAYSADRPVLSAFAEPAANPGEYDWLQKSSPERLERNVQRCHSSPNSVHAELAGMSATAAKIVDQGTNELDALVSKGVFEATIDHGGLSLITLFDRAEKIFHAWDRKSMKIYRQAEDRYLSDKHGQTLRDTNPKSRAKKCTLAFQDRDQLISRAIDLRREYLQTMIDLLNEHGLADGVIHDYRVPPELLKLPPNTLGK